MGAVGSDFGADTAQEPEGSALGRSAVPFSVASPFALTSLGYGYGWANLPKDTQLEEGVTLTAPGTAGTYSIAITVSFSPVLP